MKNNVLEGFYAELLRQPIPDPDKAKKQLYLEAAFVPSKLKHPEYWDLLDHFATVSNGKQRGRRGLKAFKRHWSYFLCCLARAYFQRRWLLVTLDNNEYASNFYLKRDKLQYTYVNEITNYLLEHELIEYREGKQYKKQAFKTRIFPTPKLMDQLWPIVLDVEQEFKPPYVAVGVKATDEWKKVFGSLPSNHPDVIDMATINEFMERHQWALKAPITLKYSRDPFSAGRLITPFQNLPDRACRLRINTLLDGKPIYEVDFNANHLRLNLAVLSGEHAGDTPYEDIAECAGYDRSCTNARSKIKTFITMAMGADCLHKARGAFLGEGNNLVDFNRIHMGALKRYPNIVLFNGWGSKAQSLEGDILKKVMIEGVGLGIASLPVHDALAVNHEYADWAQEAMTRVWSDVVGGVGTKLKVDYPTVR
ncbi:hypothetical protein N9449_03945 [Oceanospirillaceae bacterium]|nr:hypothetical protein [Oceanospirillaceae bacterium]